MRTDAVFTFPYTIVIVASFAGLSPVSAVEPDFDGYDLKRAGALTCLADDADRGAPPGSETVLSCELDLFWTDVFVMYDGYLAGEDLYLIEPGNIEVIWSVLSPTLRLDPKALIGEYDLTSRWPFDLDERTDLLIGGDADSVGLELVTPPLGPLKPETRLTLTLQEPVE